MRGWIASIGVAAIATLCAQSARAHPHPPSPYQSTEAHALPLSVSVTYGVLLSENEETYGAYNMWFAYRYRPVPETFGPFLALGGELGASSYPFKGDRTTVSIAPTFHAGVDYVPHSRSDWPEMSMFSIYFIGGYIVGPQEAYDYGQRMGVGVTFVPVTLYSGLPNMIELTRDRYFREEGTEQVIQLKLGWGF